MKITRDILVERSKELVEKRYLNDPKVDAIFLVGSVRPEDAMIDHPVDVDLLILHNGEIPRERELIKISSDYHFDLYFEETSKYENPKELRCDGWRGWSMWDPMLLHQNERFFEYTQSVLRSQFDEPKNIIGRVRFFADRARKRWASFDESPKNVNAVNLLKAVFDAGNAIACLDQQPFTKRKFFTQFYNLSNQMGLDDLIPTLFACISDSKNPEIISENLADWEHSYLEATKAYSTFHIHPLRLNYYKYAITSQLDSEFPLASFWPFAFTWAYMSEEAKENKAIHHAWKQISGVMGLDSVNLPKRIKNLDVFLEMVEEIITQVGEDYGVE